MTIVPDSKAKIQLVSTIYDFWNHYLRLHVRLNHQI